MNQLVVFPVKNGMLHCTIEDVWEQVLSCQIKCGKNFRRTTNKKIGVRREQREDLEATVKGSFGIKGIAELESSIKANTGMLVSFEEFEKIRLGVRLA